jgi:hypothetical protein
MEGAQLSLPFNTRLKTKTMSKFLSMQWFKSKIEHAVEKAIAKKIENLMEEEDNEIPAGDDYDVDRKVYIRLKLVNDVLTIVLNDGSILTKTNATQEDFERARNAVSEDQLYTICTTQEVLEERRRQEAEAKRIKALQQGIKSLEGLNDFEIEGNSVKLRGTGRTMPQLLVEKFIELVQEEKYLAGFNPGSIEDRLKDDEEYQALKRFFMWCCLNPRAEVANDLYEFLNKNSFRITKQGFFVALRNIVTLHGGTELVQFVSNAYNKVKAVWKKSPDDYTVFLENGEYKLVHYSDLYETIEEYDDETDESYEDEIAVNHGERIGGLTELYLDLPNRHENRFTDAHTRTFDIRIGRVVNMPPEECNWSTADCAHAGLHFTSDHINYVGCGDQSVLILINPMKVVGIGEQKGRCYEYLPIMTVPTEESTTILHDLDFDTLELDESFVINELENLAEIAKQGFVTEASKHQFNIPAMTYSQIENIVSQLDDMRASVSKRVVSIK